MESLLLAAVPFFLATVLAEGWFSRRRGDGRVLPVDSMASISMGLGFLFTGVFIKAIHVAAFTGANALTGLSVPMDRWWAWVILLVAEDLCYYVFHWGSHRCRLLWASHVNHHSSERYNLSTALRQTWTGGLFSFVFWIPLALVGFPAWAILLQQGINLLYQYWIHTEYIRSIGPFEKVMNSPAHHRVHHGRDEQYLDRNYAGIFIVWDRLFRTFEPEVERPTYGITRSLKSFNPFVIAFHEWGALLRDLRGARSVKSFAATLLGPPR